MSNNKNAPKKRLWLVNVVTMLVILFILLVLQPAHASCTDAVCLSGDKSLIDVNTGDGAILNALFSSLLPGTDLQLSVLSWQALVGADVELNLLLELLAAEVGVGSAAELADVDISLLQLISASADALEADGNLVALEALNIMLAQIDEIENDNLGGQLIQAATFPLSDVLDIDFETGNLLNTELNVLNLLSTGVEVLNYNSLVDSDLVILEENSPALNALGLGGLANAASFKFVVIEPARFSCGPVGTTFNSAAVRLKVELDLIDFGIADSPLIAAALGAVGGALGSNLSIEGEAGKIAIYYDIARAEGEVIAIDTAAQTAAVRVVNGVTDVYLGRFEEGVFFDRQRSLNPDTDLMPAIITRLDVGIDTPILGNNSTSLDVTVKSHSKGSSDESILYFSPPLPDTQSTDSASLAAGTIAANLINNLEVNVEASATGDGPIAPLPAALAGITDTLINALDPVIDTLVGDVFLGTLEPMLTALINSVVTDLLGVSIGAAEFTLHGVGSYCTVEGNVYYDTNASRRRDRGETGAAESLFIKLIPVNPEQDYLRQVVPVDPDTGQYSLGFLPPGDYRLVLDDNDSPQDETPSLPNGLVNTEQASGQQIIRVRGGQGRPANFGVFRGSRIVTTSFVDAGAAANNGLQESGEPSIKNARFDIIIDDQVVVQGRTNANGMATLYVSHTEPVSFDICELPFTSHYSVNASSEPASNYRRADDCFTFTLDPGSAIRANFGNVPNNRFRKGGRQAAQAGTVVNYPHKYTAGTAGQVGFAVQSEWPGTLLADADCDGIGEQAIPASTALLPEETLCLVAQVTIPGDAQPGNRDSLRITADFTPTGFTEVAETTSLTNLTYVIDGDGNGGITLTKSADVERARPGEIVTYNLAYSNLTNQPISDITINDSLPEWTSFESASCVLPLPEGITDCQAETGQGSGGEGVRWVLTGSLPAAADGAVEFSVRLDP